MEAQRQQDEDYAAIDLASFEKAVQAWRAEFETYQTQAQAYDTLFEEYEQRERRYFLDACGVPPL
jgi:Zn-dependent M32 family carboxypeptidase